LLRAQDLFPPLFALIAASAELSAARRAAEGTPHAPGAPPPLAPALRRSAAGLASLEGAGSQAYYALTWAAGVLPDLAAGLA
jgi:hypothetical protein